MTHFTISTKETFFQEYLVICVLIFARNKLETFFLFFTASIPVNAWPAKQQTSNNWSGFDSDVREQDAQQLLNVLEQLKNG